jgi:FkbM family methyltransferase
VGFIDVGSVGALPDPWDAHAYMIRRLLKFEPLDRSASDPNVTTMDVALWERDEERDFYVNRVPDGSSLLPQNFEYVRANFETLRTRGPSALADSWFERSELERIERLQCRALDAVLEEVGDQFDFLKIDAQGAELQILKGGERFLRHQCQGLHLELFTIPLYSGGALMPEVIEWLGEYGFSLLYQAPAHGTFVSQHDCLFLKPGDSAVHHAVRRAYGLDRAASHA